MALRNEQLLYHFDQRLNLLADTEIQYAADNLHTKLLIKDKLIHTDYTVKWADLLINMMGGKIERIDPLIEHTTGNEFWNRLMAKVIAMWHDAGTFAEANLNGVGGHNNSLFDQSKEGAMLFEKYFEEDDFVWKPVTNKAKLNGFSNWNKTIAKKGLAYWTAYKGVDYKIVKDAIANHGQKDYKGHNPYVYLIRDIDKLSVANRTFASGSWNPRLQNAYYDYNLTVGLTEKVLESFLKSGYVVNEDVRTISDWILKILGWRLDLNFTESKIFWDRNIIKPQIEQLRSFYPNNKTINQVILKLRSKGVDI